MAKQQQKSERANRSGAKQEALTKGATNHVIVGLALLLAGIIVLAVIAGAGQQKMVAQYIRIFVYWLLGTGELMIPLAALTAGVLVIRKRPLIVTPRETIGGGVGLLSLLGLLSLIQPEYGGIVGKLTSAPFVAGFDTVLGAVILAFVSTGSFIAFFDRTPHLFPFFERAWERIQGISLKKQNASLQEDEDEDEEEVPEEPRDEPVQKNILAKLSPKKTETLTITDATADTDIVIDTKKRKLLSGIYNPPPMNLLEGDRGKANVGDVKANANIIRRTLLNFGIEVEMDEITIGPTVTRYALKPAQGVKLSRIVGLQNDLALALAAHPLRIEAPIPGKSLVGIEIPNKTKATVGLASLIADPLFGQQKPLLAALGRNIAGKPVLYSIAKMPHLLIAGTTGSGKSVTIHTIITSLLYRHGPDELRFIFVDPKRVELTLYNGIPHLLTPVITDPKKAILSLKWAATEMNRRYDILETESVRDIDSYHKKHADEFSRPATDDSTTDRMPYIIIVIDELADIMQAFPRELEAAIVRLAQMSRAVGIHLILSTQRPEVNVITGLIKANVPSRIALRVPTQIDSRTILDTAGAEKLLGQGDMLALVGTSQAERLQSAFITEDEVKAVVAHLKQAFKDDLRETIDFSNNASLGSDKAMFSDDISDNEEDPLYEEARTVIVEAGKGSTSYLQRKLKVGYARAARLMDMLEERGIIGPADGAKPRDVLVGAPKAPGSTLSVSDQIAEEMGL